jgi:hypothetical protein
MRGEECCENCHFAGDFGDDKWLCLRYPPVFVAPPDDAIESDNSVYPSIHSSSWGQPVMCPTDWCGEYKKRISTDA